MGGPAFAPELLDVEVLSALSGLERRGKLAPLEGRRALDVFLDAPITRVPHAALLVDAWMRRSNLSAFDAVYVALPRRLGAR